MPIAAIFHKGGLQARFDAGDLGEIDIAPQLFARLALEIKFFDTRSIHHHNAGFFRVGGVDQHSFGHQNFPCGARPTLMRGAGERRSAARTHLGAA